MGRYIFKSLIVLVTFLYSNAGKTTFHDPLSFAQNLASQGENAAKYGEMMLEYAK